MLPIPPATAVNSYDIQLLLQQSGRAPSGPLSPLLLQPLATSPLFHSLAAIVRGITLGAAGSLATPCTVPATTAKVTRESYATGERARVSIRIQLHLILASLAGRLDDGASALDEERVHVRALHADDLAGGDSIVEKGDGATG